MKLFAFRVIVGKKNGKRISFLLKEVENKAHLFPSCEKRNSKKSLFFYRKCVIFLFFINKKSFFFHVKRKIEKMLFSFLMWKEKLKKISSLPSCGKEREVGSYLSFHLPRVTLFAFIVSLCFKSWITESLLFRIHFVLSMINEQYEIIVTTQKNVFFAESLI